MDIIIEAGAAGASAQLLVNMLKLGWPAMPGWALVLLSLVVGVGTTFLISLASGDVLTTQTAALNVLRGFAAAGLAGGLDRASQAAQVRRVVAMAAVAPKRI